MEGNIPDEVLRNHINDIMKEVVRSLAGSKCKKKFSIMKERVITPNHPSNEKIDRIIHSIDGIYTFIKSMLIIH